jgi:mRNA interferase MazF
MQPGEIFLAQFPFGDLPGMKLRPVLLLTGPVGSIPEVVVAYISSVIPLQPLSSDVKPRFPKASVANSKW